MSAPASALSPAVLAFIAAAPEAIYADLMGKPPRLVGFAKPTIDSAYVDVLWLPGSGRQAWRISNRRSRSSLYTDGFRILPRGSHDASIVYELWQALHALHRALEASATSAWSKADPLRVGIGLSDAELRETIAQIEALTKATGDRVTARTNARTVALDDYEHAVLGVLRLTSREAAVLSKTPSVGTFRKKEVGR